MKSFFQIQTLATGLAMFSMFFGAGNVMFPLFLGLEAGDKNPFAMIGLTVTAILVPFLGLLSMVLFKGDYRAFFGRIGKVPGFLAALLIMLILGPFGGIPRCVALSYDTALISVPGLSQFWFLAVSCLILFICAYRESRIVDLLGYLLTPLLLASLLWIIVAGWINHPAPMPAEQTGGALILRGMAVGYGTLDLLAALFFSTVVVASLRRHALEKGSLDERGMMPISLGASLIAGLLLGAIYVGLSYVAAFYAPQVEGVERSQLLGTLSFILMGSKAGWVVNAAVALACLTTAVALAAVFADFLERAVFRGRVSYLVCLVVTLGITFLISRLNFNGIMAYIGPIAVLCYPALIALSIVNIAHKLWNFRPVKLPVYAVFGVTVLYSLSKIFMA